MVGNYHRSKPAELKSEMIVMGGVCMGGVYKDDSHSTSVEEVSVM